MGCRHGVQEAFLSNVLKLILTALPYAAPTGISLGVCELMDEQPNLREFLNEVSSFSEESNAAPAKPAPANLGAIGEVVEIAGSGSQIRMDGAALTALQSHKDPSVAMSGQVGSQVKMIVGNNLLIAENLL